MSFRENAYVTPIHISTDRGKPWYDRNKPTVVYAEGMCNCWLYVRPCVRQCVHGRFMVVQNMIELCC